MCFASFPRKYSQLIACFCMCGFRLCGAQLMSLLLFYVSILRIYNESIKCYFLGILGDKSATNLSTKNWRCRTSTLSLKSTIICFLA